MTAQGHQLLELPQEYQECREYRHPWQDSNVIEQGREIEQVQVCPRCGNERSRILSLRKGSYGHVVRRWQIRYRTKTYLLKHTDDGQRATPDEWGAMRMALLGFQRS